MKSLFSLALIVLWSGQTLGVIVDSANEPWKADHATQSAFESENQNRVVEKIPATRMVDCRDEKMVPLNMLDYLLSTPLHGIFQESPVKVNITERKFDPESETVTAKIKLSMDGVLGSAGCFNAGFVHKIDERRGGNYVTVGVTNNFDFDNWISGLTKEEMTQLTQLKGMRVWEEEFEGKVNPEDPGTYKKILSKILSSNRHLAFELCAFSRNALEKGPSGGFKVRKMKDLDERKKYFPKSAVSDWSITVTEPDKLTEVVFASPRSLEEGYRNHSAYGNRGGSKYGRLPSDGSCFQYEKIGPGNNYSIIDGKYKAEYLTDLENAKLKKKVEAICERGDLNEMYEELKKGVGPLQETLMEVYRSGIEDRIGDMISGENVQPNLRDLEEDLAAAKDARSVEDLSNEYMKLLREMSYYVKGPKTAEDKAISGPSLLEELAYLSGKPELDQKDKKRMDEINRILSLYGKNETTVQSGVAKLLEFGQMGDAKEVNDMLLISDKMSRVNRYGSKDKRMRYSKARREIEEARDEFDKAAAQAYKEYEARHKGVNHAKRAASAGRRYAEKGMEIYRDFYSSDQNRQLARACQKNPQTGKQLDARKCRQYNLRRRRMLTAKSAYERRAKRYTGEAKVYDKLHKEYKEQYKESDGSEYGYFGLYTSLEPGSDFDDPTGSYMGDSFGFEHQNSHGSNFGFSAGGAVGAGIGSYLAQQPYARGRSSQMGYPQQGYPQQGFPQQGGMMGPNPYMSTYPGQGYQQNMAYQQYPYSSYQMFPQGYQGASPYGFGGRSPAGLVPGLSPYGGATNYGNPMMRGF